MTMLRIFHITLLFSAIHSSCFSQCILLGTDSLKKQQYKIVDGIHIYTTKIDTSVFNRNSIKIFCDLPDGHWRILYFTDVPAAEFYIKEGKLEHKLFYFYPNGNKTSLIKIKNNLRQGVSRHYYTNGKLRLKSHWKDDKMNGKWEYFNESGKRYMLKVYNDESLVKMEINYQERPDQYEE